MDSARRRGLVVGLLVCLPAVLFGALPALGWEVSGIPLGDAISRHESADRGRLQRGRPVRITGTVGCASMTLWAQASVASEGFHDRASDMNC